MKEQDATGCGLEIQEHAVLVVPKNSLLHLIEGEQI